MSWSGPSAGASYQPPAYGQPPYPQQPPYGQQPYAQPYQHQSYSGPPPAAPPGPPNPPPHSSKRKSNSLVTRYPVPTNYQRPPHNPQGNLSYGQGQYPPQAYQPPAQNYQPHQAYQPPPYQPGYQGYQPSPGYQHPAQGYPPPQGYPHGWQANQAYQPPPPDYGYHQGHQPPPDSAAAAAAHPPNGWPQAPPYPQGNQAGPYTPAPDPNATPTLANANTSAEGPSPQASRPPKSRRSTMTRNASVDPADLPESQRLYQSAAYTINLGLDDWDQSDYDGALWPKSNEPVNQEFSLGVIVWHPAEKITRALPSNFDDIQNWVGLDETQAIGNAESVSIYFGPDNAHEAFLSIRQTEEWDTAKHDSIFYEFTAKSDLIAVENVIANRDRPDLLEDETQDPRSEEQSDDDQKVKKESEWSVMDNLERALSTEQDGDSKSPKTSRSPSPSQVLPRDDAQEQTLAALGVTGSPKPISEAPRPASHLPPPQFSHNQKSERRKSGGRRDSERHFSDSKQPPPPPPPGPPGPPSHRNGYDAPHRSYPDQSGPHVGQGGFHESGPPQHGPSYSPTAPPPPPQRERSPSYDPWNPRRTSTNGFGGRRSPAQSDSSQRTAAGSDFHMDESDPFNPNAPDPGHPTLTRSGSSAGRKRSYEEAEPSDPKQRQEDDYTPRIKRRQPRVAAAYGRR